MAKESIGAYAGAVELVYLCPGMLVPLEAKPAGIIVIIDEARYEIANWITQVTSPTLEFSFLHLSLLKLRNLRV